MKRFGGVICILFVVCMLASPLLISVEANNTTEQTVPTFSGELIPDPDFTEEPYVEIGAFSPEFDYEYTPGSVSLLWMHTAGYELSYDYHYSPYCLEYARVSQTFESSHNESIESVKLSASVRLDCTGDFAVEDIMDNLWVVNIEISRGLDRLHPIRTITDLKNGDTEDIEFMLTEQETYAYFHGPEEPVERTLSVQLIPSEIFLQTLGDFRPWMNYSGSVVLTITHMSFEVMEEGKSQAPLLMTPIYNTTLLSNETTSHIIGIESAGYDQIYQYRINDASILYGGVDVEYSVFTLHSNHSEIRNRTVYRSDTYSYYYGIYSFAASNDRIAMLTIYSNETTMEAKVQCLDSFGNFYWNTTVSLYYQDIPLLATFDVSGNLFVYMLSLHSQTSDLYDQVIVTSIVKIDNLGNVLWNNTLEALSYWDYVSSVGVLATPAGIGCIENDLFIAIDDELIKLDSDGEQIWRKPHSQDKMCTDPLGGLYTFANIHGVRSELTRWDTSGNIEWTRSLGWDYGDGWMEYPSLQAMSVGDNGLLHLVLGYNSLNTSAVLARVSQAGDVLSQDTIFEVDWEDEDYYYNFLPYIMDITITGDGLVHIVGGRSYGSIYSPFTSSPGTFLITYELPAIQTVFPVSPVSLTMVGIASVLIIGIAYDFFFRRGGVPEPPVEPTIADFEW